MLLYQDFTHPLPPVHLFNAGSMPVGPQRACNCLFCRCMEAYLTLSRCAHEQDNRELETLHLNKVVVRQDPLSEK